MSFRHSRWQNGILKLTKGSRQKAQVTTNVDFPVVTLGAWRWSRPTSAEASAGRGRRAWGYGPSGKGGGLAQVTLVQLRRRAWPSEVSLNVGVEQAHHRSVARREAAAGMTQTTAAGGQTRCGCRFLGATRWGGGRNEKGDNVIRTHEVHVRTVC